MFLNQLNKKEKETFMSLSVHMANANKIIADEEKEMIQEYCREMGLVSFDIKDAIPMEDVLGVFQQSDLHIRKVVLFEILGLAYADGEYENSEDAFVIQFAKAIGLSKETVEEYETLLLEYLGILKKIVQIVS